MIPSGIQKHTHFAMRIIQITKIHAAGRANGHACRVEPLLHPVNAERALVCVSVRMDKSGVVRTGCNACLASDASLVVNQDNVAVVMDMAGSRGTTIDARRIVALVAALTSDLHMQCWKRPLRVIHNPIPVISLRNAIFRLAGHNAVHAANTLCRIDHHAEPSQGTPPARW